MISGRITALCAATALALSLASLAQTNVYRWVDRDGQVHFTDTPPPPDVKESTQKRMGGGAALSATQVPYETQLAARRNPVTLYSSTKCGELCANGRELLAKRGVPFTEKLADVDPKDGEAVRELTGKLQVPVLKVGDKHVNGFAADAWNSTLDAAGYARTALPGQTVPPPPPPPAPPPPAPPPPDSAAQAPTPPQSPATH